jgi:hypothetical protein
MSPTTGLTGQVAIATNHVTQHIAHVTEQSNVTVHVTGQTDSFQTLMFSTCTVLGSNLGPRWHDRRSHCALRTHEDYP